MLSDDLKHYFIGITLSPTQNVESAMVILDKNLKIITLDKAFSIKDIAYFLDNFPSKKNSVIMVSIPEDITLLNSKWKVLAKKFQLLGENKLLKNRQNWADKTTDRGLELFLQYKNEGIDIFRFDVFELKKSLGLAGMHKDRSPADCKYLQNVLKMKFFIEDIPSNMFPVAQLEGILGAMLAHKMFHGKKDIDYKMTHEYCGIEVINSTATVRSR